MKEDRLGPLSLAHPWDSAELRELRRQRTRHHIQTYYVIKFFKNVEM